MPADRAAELADVGVRCPVTAFVLGLRVDDEAVGTLMYGGRPPFRLGFRMPAVDVLPTAHAKSAVVEVLDEPVGELAPCIGAVGALDVERPYPVLLGLARDLRQLAAA